MKAERWREIDRLLDAAMEVDAGGRPAFLDQACGSDSALRAELESLLEAYDQLGNFIQTPAMEMAARKLAGEKNQAGGAARIPAGQRIGPYRVVSLLGAGGMGEVYLAEDTKLGRKIALKLLPAEFTQDRERVRRFEREARAASALNHPNIITLFDIGEADGIHYIATEYVEGRTLRERMSPGRIEPAEAIEIGIQIAGALSAAHEAGIIHRDIKPENIMLRRDGYVKVLDFGLVKLSERETLGGGAQDLTSSITMTDPGRVMGTISYMAPEQALGEKVDRRTDIFSLGVVVYEMLTGALPFKGNTQAAIFDAILHGSPIPVTGSNPGLPAELDHVINRALEKDYEMRYQTASDLRAELKRLQRDLHSSDPPVAGVTTSVTGSRSRGLRWLALIAVCVLAVAAVSVYLFDRYFGRPADPIKPTDAIKITDMAGEELFPSLAPDGDVLVYVSKASGNADIYWQRVGGRNSKNLTEDCAESDTQPAFSFDGKQIAFRSGRDGGGIFLMGATGESVRRLTDFGYNPAWSPDGSAIVCSTESITTPSIRSGRGELYVVRVATNERRLISEGDAVQPSWSPRGHRIAYWGLHKGAQRDIWTIPAGGGEPRPVTDDPDLDWNPVWSPDGRYLYFVSDRGGSTNLWRVEIEEETGKVLGQPEPLTVPAYTLRHISVSRDNRRIVYVQMVADAIIHKVAFDPKTEQVTGGPTAITLATRRATSPDLSPDGQWFASGSEGARQEDIFLTRNDGSGQQRQLTDDTHTDRVPRWSPDSKRLAFYSDKGGSGGIWVINADGSNLQLLARVSGATASLPVWSPDSARLAYRVQGEGTFILELNPHGGHLTAKPLPPMGGGGSDFVPHSWSADGRLLAGSQAQEGSRGSAIVVYSFDTGRYERLLDYGASPTWFSDGRRLLFSHDGKLLVLDSRSKRVKVVYAFAPYGSWGYGLSRDDRLIYFTRTSSQSDVWLSLWK